MLLFSVYVIDAYYLNSKRQYQNKKSKVNTGVEDEIVYEKKGKNPKSMNHSTGTTESNSGRRGCTRKAKQAS